MRIVCLSLVFAATAMAWQETSPHSTLYVATSNTIYLYSLGASTPRLTITDGLASVTQIAVDSISTIYASNFGTPNQYADSSVTEYPDGQTTPALTRTMGAFSAAGVAVDRNRNVFASSFYPNTISSYAPGSGTPFLGTQNGVAGPGLLAFNGGDLYVGEAGSAQIVRFPFGSAAPDLTINLKAPGSLPPGALTYGGPFAIGRDGSVYAAGFVIAADVGFEEFVNVFAPGAASPRASIVVSTGPNAATSPWITVAGSNLFVSVSDLNRVVEYAIRAGLKPVRTIMSGLNMPGPMAVDARSRLYVGNAGGQVTVFPSGAITPKLTITLPNFGTPVSLVIAH